MFRGTGRTHRLRLALAAGAAGAVIAAVGASSAGVAAASATAGRLPAHPAAARPLPATRVAGLHSYYEKALTRVRAGKISGIVYPRGHQPKERAGASTAGCSEPNCPLVYNGGSVQHSPRVYLLLWGPNWTTDPAQEASYGYLWNFYSGLGSQPQDTWSSITEQYGDGSGQPTFGGSVFGGAWQDSSTPPQGVSSIQLAAEAYAFALSNGIPDWSNAQVVVATQAGTCPQGFACPGANGSYCAWHSNVLGLSYINLPYQIDAGGSCGENYVRSQYDGFSIVGGHEYAETVTDPSPNSGWIDTSDSGGGEIGDKCAWQGLGTVALPTGTFAVQSLYNNQAYYYLGRGCTLAWPDAISVTSPGNQTSAVHTAVSLQVHASGSGGYPLNYAASGLPPGLSINAGTGVISGSPTSTGSYPVTVSAWDASGARGSASFTWTVTGAGDQVSVTSPGPQTSMLGDSTSLQIKASSSGGNPLTFTATGLPRGLSISATTGVISGSPTIIGTASVTVSVSDTTGSSAAVTFGWTVKKPPICGTAGKICCTTCLHGAAADGPTGSSTLALTARRPAAH